MNRPTRSKLRRTVRGAGAWGLSALAVLAVGLSTAQAAQLVWDISEIENGKCYSQDMGCVVRDGPANPGWLLFYGAVTDKNGISTCVSPGYSEDIFVTWSTTEGITFGQDAGSTTAPLTLLTSADYEAAYGTGPGASCPACTGWHIGDPAVVYGEATGTWYMFFDSQSCASASSGTWDPLTVATSTDWHSGWTIQAQITTSILPGHGDFAMPHVFKDPTDGRIYLFYGDHWVQIRVAELIDDGTGINLVPLNGGNPVLPSGAADSMSVYYADGGYWAVADNFGNGFPEDLHTLWRMGPGNSPYTFVWDDRQAFLIGAGWYDYLMWAPSCLGSVETGDGTVRCYFWANGGSGNSCDPGGGVQTGVAIETLPCTPLADIAIIGDGGGYSQWWYTETPDADGLSDGTVAGEASFGGPPAADTRLLLGDVDGNGYDDRIMVSSAGYMAWWLDLSDGTGGAAAGVFGDATVDENTGFGGGIEDGWTPLIGDKNGDGLADRVAVYADTTPDTYGWFFDLSDGQRTTTTWFGDSLDDYAGGAFHFGAPSTETPCLGDFNGDGMADRAAYDPIAQTLRVDYTPGASPGSWGDGVADLVLTGLAGMGPSGGPAVAAPKMGDFDTDCRADVYLYQNNQMYGSTPATAHTVYYSSGNYTARATASFGGPNVWATSGHLGGPVGTIPVNRAEIWRVY